MAIPTKLFSVDCDEKNFCAEASDLNGYFNVEDIIVLQSDLGGTAEFILSRTVREESDHEIGDIQCWMYRPSRQALAANPRLGGWSVTILND